MAEEMPELVDVDQPRTPTIKMRKPDSLCSVEEEVQL